MTVTSVAFFSKWSSDKESTVSSAATMGAGVGDIRSSLAALQGATSLVLQQFLAALEQLALFSMEAGCRCKTTSSESGTGGVER